MPRPVPTPTSCAPSSTARIAVLLRHPSRAVALENHLLERGVEYTTLGFDSYLRRPEVLFVRGVLAHALGAFDAIENVQAREAVVHAMLLFMGGSVLTTTAGVDDELVVRERQSVARLAAGGNFGPYVEHRLLGRLDDRASHAIAAAVAVARSNHVDDIARFAATLDVRGFASRVLVHAAQIDAVSESIDGVVRAAAGFESIERFLHVLNEREQALGAMKPEQCIRLSTIEAAKGLEHEHVVIPGLDSGEFDGRSTQERNLFYVALSRAKHLATLLHRPSRPSSYLQGAGII